MFSTIGRAATLAATAIAALAAVPASAAQFTFDFTKLSTGAMSRIDTSACPAGAATCTAAQRLNVSIFGGHLNSVGSGTSTLSGASVQGFGGAGLGVLFGSDNGGDASHQIDNAGGGSDFVALFFDQAVTLASIFRANYSSARSPTGYDTDASYLAFSNQALGPDDTLKLTSFSTLRDQATATNSAASSQVWLVGARVDGQTNDAFKLSGIVANTVPMSAVPEPATWAMMLVGFGAVGVSMRRRAKTGRGALRPA